MGGIISLLISVWAAYLLYGTGHRIPFFAAIAIGVLTFWCIGVMHNYASYARRDRANRLRENLRSESRLDNDAERRLASYERGLEPQAIPNWLAIAKMLLFVISAALLISAFLIR